MNLDINRYSNTLVTLFVLALVAKALSLTMLYFLEKKGVSQVSDITYTMPYQAYRFSKTFAIVEQKVQTKQKTAAQTKPLYNLNSLMLKAIYKSKNGGFIVALDKTKNNKSVFIKLHNEYNGYTLKSITQNRATFERNNQEYKLEFVETKSMTMFKKAPSPKPPSYDNDVIRAVAKTEVHKYTKDFKSIWKSIAIKEVVKNGKITGFKVNFIKEGTIFDKLGLKKDDLIIAVNNKPMLSYASAFKVYGEVNKMTSLKITVIRNNQEKDLEYEIY